MKGLVTAASVHAFPWPLTRTLSSTSPPAQDSPPFTPPSPPPPRKNYNEPQTKQGRLYLPQTAYSPQGPVNHVNQKTW